MPDEEAVAGHADDGEEGVGKEPVFGARRCLQRDDQEAGEEDDGE